MFATLLLDSKNRTECPKSIRDGDPRVLRAPPVNEFADPVARGKGHRPPEAESLDAAVALARRIPTLPAGGTVEVRPLEVRDA